MTTRDMHRRLVRLEERVRSPEPDPPYILITLDDARDPGRRLTDDDITGCGDRNLGVVQRLPGESLDAMCTRARHDLWQGRDGVPVLLAVYPPEPPGVSYCRWDNA